MQQTLAIYGLLRWIDETTLLGETWREVPDASYEEVLWGLECRSRTCTFAPELAGKLQIQVLEPDTQLRAALMS